jgi:nitroimidazol reductase NimA-like FMN-containing flavoprotein (pyridoxamine 5'-phosphate oxidase superfamily)
MRLGDEDMVEVIKITDIGEIEEIIEKALVCRLGLVDGDEPYVIPVFFGYERSALYFHGGLAGLKVELIKRNNKACFEIDIDAELVKSETPCKWAMKGKSVVGIGRTTILEGDEEKSRTLRLTMRHYGEGEFSFPKPMLDSVIVIKIEIDRLTGKKIV